MENLKHHLSVSLFLLQHNCLSFPNIASIGGVAAALGQKKKEKKINKPYDMLQHQ